MTLFLEIYLVLMLSFWRLKLIGFLRTQHLWCFLNYNSWYFKCLLTGYSILLVFFIKLSFMLFMVRCFFLLINFLVAEDYELPRSKIHILNVLLTLECVHYKELNLSKNITISLHKNIRKLRLKLILKNGENKQTNKKNKQTTTTATTNNKNKQKQKTNKKIEQQQKKWYPPNPNSFFRRLFHKYFTSFYLKNLFIKHYLFTLWNDVIYYEPFLCKSNCFHWVSQSNFFLYRFYFSDFRYEVI